MKYYRDMNDVCYGLLSPSAGMSVDPSENQRIAAVFEVLRRIPDHDYEALVELVETFSWFIPHEMVLGMCYPFPASADKTLLLPEGIGFSPDNLREHAVVLYLNPKLERSAWDIAVAVVAHELAHVFMRHRLRTASNEEYEKQEQEAFDCLVRWGFKAEAKKHAALCKRRSTLEEKDGMEL